MESEKIIANEHIGGSLHDRIEALENIVIPTLRFVSTCPEDAHTVDLDDRLEALERRTDILEKLEAQGYQTIKRLDKGPEGRTLGYAK